MNFNTNENNPRRTKWTVPSYLYTDQIKKKLMMWKHFYQSQNQNLQYRHLKRMDEIKLLKEITNGCLQAEGDLADF